MIRVSALVAAPPRTLWTIVSDLDRWDEHLPTVRSIRRLGGPNPTDVGSRFELAQPGLPTMVYEVTAWDPGRRFVWEARSPGVVSTATHIVAKDASGSRLELTFDWSGPFGWLAGMLATKKGLQMVQTEARRFSHLAELPPASPVSPVPPLLP